jgi:hypothetical protein
MTDQIKDAAAQVILAALHTAEQTGEWIKGQIPDVLGQLIRYNIVIDAIWTILCAALIGLGLWLSIRYRRWIIREADGFPYFLWVMPGVFVLAGFCICSSDLLEILIAPKVWILEYARHLL